MPIKKEMWLILEPFKVSSKSERWIGLMLQMEMTLLSIEDNWNNNRIIVDWINNRQKRMAKVSGIDEIVESFI